jgi:hypothetical protein
VTILQKFSDTHVEKSKDFDSEKRWWRSWWWLLMEALICDLGDLGFGLVVTRSWTNIGERKKGIFLILVFWKRLNFKASIFVVILWVTEEIEAQSSNLFCYFEFLIELESFNLFESFLFTLTLTHCQNIFSISLSLSLVLFSSLSL